MGRCGVHNPAETNSKHLRAIRLAMQSYRLTVGLLLCMGLFDGLEPQTAWAGEEENAINRTLPPASLSRLNLQVLWGPVWPGGEAVTQIYTGPLYRSGISARYQVWDSLSVSVGVGYIKHDGVGIGKESGTVSEQVATLSVYPLELGGVYRFDRLALGTVVPYVSAGLDCQPYTEVVEERTYSGGKWGYHVRGGIEVVLDPPPPAWTSDARGGLQSTALLIELGYSGVNNFGNSTLDFSGTSLTVGFALGF